MLTTGRTLGPYRILALLGTGGMGEVYRARDTRLGRDVAVKVLSPELTARPDLRARFQREARTVSQLAHPHIGALFDVGHEGGIDYLVMELLDGETLAQRLEKGPLPVADVLALGRQIAEALDGAHAAGVVHRDLKPGNIMLTKSGVKLMDFGLARPSGPLTAPTGALSQSPTLSRPLTAEGAIVGTLQYMAPEQLEGKEADVRSDLWALGCVLYEMATGARAFAGESQASAIAAIMTVEPQTMAELRPLTPPALEHIVVRCLAKDPGQRWQSARDVAHELDWVRTSSGVQTPPAPRGRAPGGAGRWVVPLLGGATLLAVGVLFGLRTRPAPDAARVTYTRLTVQRGRLGTARFSPDGKTVFYSANWDGRPPEVFEVRPGFPTPRGLGLPNTLLLGISRTGTMVVLVDQRLGGDVWYRPGTMAEVPISGGNPRPVSEGILYADWLPDGRGLAAVRRSGAGIRLEIPLGHVLRETAGDFSCPRVSPDGRHLAFIDHPFSTQDDTRGSFVVVDTSGRIVVRTTEWNSALGVAWSADGREVWYCGSQDGVSTDLRALALAGRERVVARFDGHVRIHDVGSDGRVLLERLHLTVGIRSHSASERDERELGWYDYSIANDLSADGRTLLFGECGLFGGPQYAVCLRGTDGSAPLRLGPGTRPGLSPDGRWAVAILLGPPQRLLILPIGAGDSTSLPGGRIERYLRAGWLPDGKHVVFAATEPGHRPRTYVQDLAGGLPRPVTPDGLRGHCASPDGRFVAAVSADRQLYACPLDGDSARFVTHLLPDELVLRWSADSRSIFLGREGASATVRRVDVSNGRATPWATLGMADSAGLRIASLVLTPDGRSGVYTYLRKLSDLFLVEGLR
jgi:eukaryotic-like serine/threonine-protein kinase